MAKKSKADRSQKVNLNVVLVNQTLGLDNPRNKDVSGCILNQDDPRLREFSEVFKRCFAIESNGYRGYSIPIGAFQDCRGLARDFDASETFEVALPKELYQLVLIIRDVLESNGVSATDSEIVRFMIWTKFPASVTPNGHLIASGSTSWCYDAAGLLHVIEDSYYGLQFGQPGNVDLTQLTNAFIDGGWAPSLKATSVMIRPNQRISVLTVEVLKEVDDGKEDIPTDDKSTINIKEDTNNESIK